ncbi:MAG: ATP-binding cassette domain-containing protein [Clostridiales Family XIII bacterium]|jgi:energy-coupling factor transport system ATP-binding protein|nr:ATP-binding cassette domain-containing protein [Clostridiales Family XIII bacterium]
MDAFTIKRFTFTYRNRETPALDDIELVVREGEFVTLCGKSGSGKSTLLRSLKTMLAPPGVGSGRITFFGRPVEMIPPLEQMRRIGHVMQDPDSQIATNSVRSELSAGLLRLGLNERIVSLRVAEMVSFFGMQSWFHQDVSALSGGQKQMLTLAAAMSLQPEVLLLDEPTAQLDPIAARDFLDTVRKINRETGTAVIISEQRLEEVFPMSDRAVVLDRGKIVVDAPPKRVGVTLMQLKHDMVLAMPAPMQVFLELEQDAAIKWRRSETGSLRSMGFPITVRDGREWLSDLFREQPPTKRAVERSRDHAAEESRTNYGIAFLDRAHPCVAPDKSEPAVELKDLRFRYDKNGSDVIKDLNLTVPKETLFCIVGGNGVGKSTAVRLIGGQLGPYRGKILIDGKEVKKHSAKDRDAGAVSLLPQNQSLLFTDGTVMQNFLSAFDSLVNREGNAFAQYEKEGQIAAVTALLTLDDLLGREPKELSAGEQQRVALGLILLRESRILLLDEPTKGLDNHFKQRFAIILRALISRGKTILMVSHDVEFCARYADICALFFDGGIVAADEPGAFFSGNSFYTTAANRMSRHIFENTVTTREVIALCRENIVHGESRD